jgi:UDP-N-acetylmuramoyl-tripeptide--D-alanyl-D-alanine ligase
MKIFANTQEVDTFLRERKALRAGGRDGVFERVCTDTRKLQKGDLFVALKGDTFDAHEFVIAAHGAGALGAVVSREWAKTQDRIGLTKDGFALWMVDDTLLALGDLARGHLRRLGATRAALTGSNGKTTTKEFTAAILKAHFGDEAVLYTHGNLNNQVGVPLTAFGCGQEHRVALFEMGMNHTGEIAAMCRIADPSATLITNVGPAHIGNFDGKIERIADAKGEIYLGTSSGGTLCVNLEDARVVAQAGKVRGHTVVTYGRGADAQWRLTSEKADSEGQDITLTHAGAVMNVRLNALGAHNALNACAAATLASVLGATHDDVVKGLQAAHTVSGRLTQRRATNGATVVDDSYNANPSSMKAAMDVARLMVKPGGRLILVLGDMLELGEMEKELHRQVGAAAAACKPAQLWLSGPRSKDTAAGATEAGFPTALVMHSEQLESLLPQLTKDVQPQDVVLVKGSRGARMERAVAALCGTQVGTGH